MNDYSSDEAKELPLANHQLHKENSFVFDATKTFQEGSDSFQAASNNLDFGQDQQLSEQQTPQSRSRARNPGPVAEHNNEVQGSSTRRRDGGVPGTSRIKESANGQHFEVHLSQLEKEDIDTSPGNRHNLSQTFPAPSGSATRFGEERSRSNVSNVSGRLKFTYQDEQNRESTKFNKFDLPMREVRDFSKALSLFSMKRESVDSDRISSVLKPARIGSGRRVSQNRLNEKQLRMVTQSSESPLPNIGREKDAHLNFSQTLRASQEKMSLTNSKSHQVFVGQSSFSHESFGQKTSHPAESTAKQRESPLKSKLMESPEKIPENRPMIQVYSRPIKNPNKPTMRTMKANQNKTNIRISNVFFPSKTQQTNNTFTMADKRVDSAFSMQGVNSSPLLKKRGGGPNINTSQEMKPKGLLNKISSNFDSVESPESKSRQQSASPMPRSKGDISSTMNQYNQEDCVDSPKFDAWQTRNINKSICNTSKQETESAYQRGRKQGMSGVLSDKKTIEMGGLIMSREENHQYHPKLLKKQERVQQQSANKIPQITKQVQPSPRFTGTNKLNMQFHNFSKHNPNLRQSSRPPINPMANGQVRQSSASPPFMRDSQLRLDPKEHPYLARMSKFSKSSRTTSLFQRPSYAPSNGSIFKHSQESNKNQIIRNRSTLSRGLAQSRGPSKVNPNEKLFTKSGPFNPLISCNCSGKGQRRDSLAMTRQVMPPPPPISETLVTGDEFESDYEVISNAIDNRKASMEMQQNQIDRRKRSTEVAKQSQVYHQHLENVPESDPETREIIVNQERDSCSNQMQTPDTNGNFRLKLFNRNYEYGSFHKPKNIALQQDYQQQDLAMVMHNVSPRFNRESLDRQAEQYQQLQIRESIDREAGKYQQMQKQEPYECLQDAPRPKEIMSSTQYQFPTPDHVIEAAVVGMSIQPQSEKNLQLSQRDPQEQSTMMVSAKQQNFDTTNRHAREEPAQPRVQRAESIDVSEREEMLRNLSNEKLSEDIEKQSGGNEDYDEQKENLNEEKQLLEDLNEIDHVDSIGNEMDHIDELVDNENFGSNFDNDQYVLNNNYRAQVMQTSNLPGESQVQPELNLSPSEGGDDSHPQKQINHSILEKDDEFDNDLPNPEMDQMNFSIEKSDRTNKTNYGMSKAALQQSQEYIDSNQVGNEEQVTIIPEQTTDTNDSPERVNPDDEINPNVNGDKSRSSSQKEKSLKKSFEYGLEDVNNDSSQMLNLNITKHNESVRDAPLDPKCSSLKISQSLEGELKLQSEIKKPLESYDNKPGVDNSLAEVMKVFKENEKKMSKGNFGWNRAVQHTTIRLTDIEEEAKRINRKHMRSGSKVSNYSRNGNRLLGENYARQGIRSSQGSFALRMHQLQRDQFGIGSRLSSRISHSKQASIASSYMKSRKAVSRLGPIDGFSGNGQRVGIKTYQGNLGASYSGNQSSRNLMETQTYSSSFQRHLGTRRRPTNVKGVMKTQINLASTYNRNSQASSLYAHVVGAKKTSRDQHIRRLQQTLSGKATGNRTYRVKLEKKKEMPFQLGTGPQDHLVCQGKLLRYKPGIEKDFVTRWVQMTKQDFRYFENNLKAEGCLKAERLALVAKLSGHQALHNTNHNIQYANAVPLISIPTASILKAIRLRAEDFEVSNNRNKMEQKDLYKNLFEIKLKCDYKDLRNYRDEIKANIDTITQCSPIRQNHNHSNSRISKRTQSISSFYGSPIPKKKNMFVKRFSKSPNIINDQIGQNSFNRNIIKHKKSHSRQQEELKDLNSAIVNKVKIKLNKTLKRNENSMSPSPSQLYGSGGQASVERDISKIPKGKEAIIRSRSQVQLRTDKKLVKRVRVPSQLSGCEGGTQPVTQRVSLSKTKSSNLHSHRESMVSQQQQQKMRCRKKSAAALFSKSKFGKINQPSLNTAQSEALMLSFGQSLGDDISGKSQVHHHRSPSKNSNGKLRKVIPGQLMPMPLNQTNSSSNKFFLTPYKDNQSGSSKNPKQFNVPLSQPKTRAKGHVRDCMSQQFLKEDQFFTKPKTRHCKKNTKLSNAINPYVDRRFDDTKSNGKIIQICASNKSIGYQKSRYTDETQAAISDRKQVQQWSQRQQLWYQEEKRIIFSAQSQDQVTQWVRTINKFVQEQGHTLLPDLASDQFSTFGQSKKSMKIKKIKKKIGTERQMLKGLKQFNKGQKRQIKAKVSQY